MRSNIAFIKKRAALALKASGSSSGGTTVTIKWNTVAGGVFDPITRCTIGATMTPNTATVQAFIHFVQPASIQIREFLEIEAGDAIVDFAADAPLDGRPGIYFEFAGASWEPKPISDRLTQSWDVVARGQRLFRTLLLRKRGPDGDDDMEPPTGSGASTQPSDRLGYVQNESTNLWHKIRARNNPDGAVETFLDDTGVSAVEAPALPRTGYVLNETTGLWHKLRARTNGEGVLEYFLDETGVA